MKKDLYSAESSVSGKGVFASRSFKKGDTVFIIKGKPIYFIPKTKEDSNDIGHNWFCVGKNIYLEITDEVTQYVNHSCDPNLGIKGSVTFIALRNIKKDEEINFDYSITEEDLLWEMKNFEPKNTKNYRPVIKSIQSLSVSVYKKYLPYIPKYFQKVYKRELS
ncbi:MAG: SET domain-containing protein [Candidatus Pacebacteria bacterium]|nr:SET domain-containing protein [Candidatus Paceibacterota bacterium]